MHSNSHLQGRDPVLRQTILSAALSEYPLRRITVLIDDPPTGSAESLRSLETTRHLVADLHARFHAAATHYHAELSDFLVRLHSEGGLDLTWECGQLADLYEGMADWIEALVGTDEPDVSVNSHTDKFFREHILLRCVMQHRCRANELRKGGVNLTQVQREYRRLAALLFLEITSFERKRFAICPTRQTRR